MIYKIVPEWMWRDAERTNVFLGAPVDLADGFIHFSAADQVAETLAKHFAGQTDLLLVAVDPDRLGEKLVWEVSRGGANFPHLYAGLALSDVAWVKPMPVASDGHHDLAGLVP